MMEEFYTVQDLMRIFRISKNTAYSLIHSPGFPLVKVGKTLRVPAGALEEYLYKNAADRAL